MLGDSFFLNVTNLRKKSWRSLLVIFDDYSKLYFWKWFDKLAVNFKRPLTHPQTQDISKYVSGIV